MRLCPRATVLATSREVMRIQGESVYRVPALDVPAPEQEAPDIILGHSAVELFVTRAKALDAGFSPQPEDLSVDRRDLPTPRRHSARHRVRRGPRRLCRNRAGGRRPARSLRAVDQRAPHRDPAAPDLASRARLELRAAVGGRAAPAASPCCLPGGIYVRGRPGRGRHWPSRSVDRRGVVQPCVQVALRTRQFDTANAMASAGDDTRLCVGEAHPEWRVSRRRAAPCRIFPGSRLSSGGRLDSLVEPR